MKLVVTVVALVLTTGRVAHAISACTGAAGWSPTTLAVLPTRAHLVYWSDEPRPPDGKGLVATIDGKPVAIKVTAMAAPPYDLIGVEIDSDRAGTLQIGWKGAMTTYQVTAKTKLPTQAHWTATRYHHKLGHTTVREVFDGLAIHVDVPAILAHVKLRRDDKAPWVELDVPVADRTIRIGELGCKTNFTVELLERGVDLDVELRLPDDSHVRVKNLTHVAIPKLAKPTSDMPWDSE